jgi:hypothetical protein
MDREAQYVRGLYPNAQAVTRRLDGNIYLDVFVQKVAPTIRENQHHERPGGVHRPLNYFPPGRRPIATRATRLRAGAP